MRPISKYALSQDHCHKRSWSPLAWLCRRHLMHNLPTVTDFSCQHWRQIWSTNPLEQLNKELKRRMNVVDVLPNSEALLR